MTHQAAGQSGSQAAKQPGSQAARQPGSQAARQPGRQADRQPDSQAARQPSRRAAATLPQEQSLAKLSDADRARFKEKLTECVAWQKFDAEAEPEHPKRGQEPEHMSPRSQDVSPRSRPRADGSGTEATDGPGEIKPQSNT